MNAALLSEIFNLSVEHAVLVLVAIGAACAIGLPASVALTRRAGARRWVLGIANIGQTIPSLALFGFLVPLVGIGKGAAILALTLYALLPILRNTLTGILGVDPAVRESARGPARSRSLAYGQRFPTCATAIESTRRYRCPVPAA